MMPSVKSVVGTWVNTSFSIIAMYTLVHVMVSDLAETSALGRELREGIERGEFFLHYQPQVTSQGRVVGAEVLLRWQQPERGLIPPDEFIALAEKTGLILPLGLWTLGAACEQLAQWARDPQTAHCTVAVNVSAHQLQQADFVQQVQSTLERTGAQARSLKLELTESVLAHDLDDIIVKMTALKALGVGFSLDDFGTGYSSLSYLKHLPLDQLKIDQSFVRDVHTNAYDASIARTIISLGQGLNFGVIAEGVEEAAQRDFLVENGCHNFQGDFFSKPISATEFAAFVVKNSV